MKNFRELREAAKRRPQMSVAVAAAEDDEVIAAVLEAERQGLAHCLLTGDEVRIRGLLASAGADPASFEIIAAASHAEAAALAVRLIRQNRAQMLMKGILSTSELMRAVLNKEEGLRGSGLISHAMLMEAPAYPKLLLLTDGGMCPFPTLEEKAQILEHAADLLLALGYEKIYAAALAAVEKANPKIKDSMEAAELAAMEERWRPRRMSVYGPASLDIAISPEACRHKNYRAEGAGEADILLVPDYQVGNCLGKAISYFGGAANGGLILGAKVPIMLVSRADSHEAKLNSIALAVLFASAKK